MMNNGLINPLHFLSLSLKLGLQACRIVKDSYMNKSVKHFLKAVDDPVTQADYKIQSMLIKGYKLHYPNLKIVGQEDKQYQGIVQTNYQKLEFPQIPNKITFPKQYQASKSCLWIDPIDNTKGFISGQIQAVTNLIGLSYDMKSELGIIGIPFKKNKENRVYYNPSLLFGSVAGGFAYQFYPKENRWVQLKKNDKTLKQKAKVAMSPFRQNIVQNKIVQYIKGQKILAGGSGYKMALVAKKQADMMAYSQSLSQKWDTCAGQAIIKAMKGYCTTQYGQQITYDPNKPKQYNQNGVICCFDPELLKTSIKICEQFKQQLKK